MMQKTIDVLIGVALALLSILALPLAPFVALFEGRSLRIDTIVREVDGAHVPVHVWRYELPRWLSWFQTPDEPMPGALYEPAIVSAFMRGGQWWAATCWLWRNSLYGLAWRFGLPADDYLDLTIDGTVVRGRLWRWRKTVGPLVLLAGWKVHRAGYSATAEGGPYRAIRFASLRLQVNA